MFWTLVALLLAALVVLYIHDRRQTHHTVAVFAAAFAI